MILLDTCFCIDWLRENSSGTRGNATKKLISLGDEELFVSLFTACELDAGAACSKDPDREKRKIERFLEHVTIIQPERAFSSIYGEIVAHLKNQGKLIPVMDTLIAACALQERMRIATRDIEHFSRIPGVRIEEYC